MVNDYIQPLQSIWDKLLENVVLKASDWLVQFIYAVAILLIGYLVAKLIKQIIVKLLQSTKIDQWIEEQNLSAALGNRDISVIAGKIAQWWITIVVLQQVMEVLRLGVIGGYLQAIAAQISLGLAALVMIIIGLLIARYVRNAIESTTHRFRRSLAVAVEIVVIYVTAVIALKTVGINVTMLEQAFLIAVAACALVIAIIIGISFGLAFKDDAQSIASDIRKAVKR